jgi:hypothetical protein
VREVSFKLGIDKRSGALGRIRIIERHGTHRTQIKLNRKHVKLLLRDLNAFGFVTWDNEKVVLRKS